jgi:hypothetical protein
MKALQESLGLRIEDMTWQFGVTDKAWATGTNPPPAVTREDGSPIRDSNGNLRKSRPDMRGAPWGDATTSILARFLERYPQCSLVPPKQDVQTVLDLIEDVCGEDVRKRVFSLAMGREASAAHRWLTGTNETSTTIDHALRVLQIAMADPSIGEYAWDEWLKCVEEEAISRGEGDIWGRNSWPKHAEPLDDEATGD